MFARYLVVALILVCAKAECQTKPLAFNGVRLGQRWSEFLKAHPKAELFMPYESGMELIKAKDLVAAGKQKTVQLVEDRIGELFVGTIYLFDKSSLVRTMFLTERNPRKTELATLKEPLSKLLVALGNPTAQATTSADYGDGHRLMLVWKTPTQSAYANIVWPLNKEKSPTYIELQLINAPWRTTNSSTTSVWPSILPADKQDEEHSRQLIALMEQLRPHSTDGIQELAPAPAIMPKRTTSGRR
jgi:hypothetical protein